MSRLVLRDLAVVVTVDAADTVLRDVSLAVEDGVITEIGQVEVREADEVLYGRGRLALPGLVNLHTHLPMTLLRGIAEGVDLQGFLERVWAAEGAVMDPATVELGATLGALESLLGGCTTQLDMYFHHEAAHRGAVAAGARHVGGPTFFDGPGPDGLSWDERMAGLRAWPDVLRATGGPEVPVAAMPHATYTNSVEHLSEVASVLRELTPAGVLHTHASENAAENADLLDRVGATPTQLLARAGWISPRRDDGVADGVRAGEGPRVVLGHGVHLTDEDRATAAAADAAVAHCPASNLKLASGALDWQRWRADGIRLGIGTDGCASSNDLDMWQAMRQAAHLAALTSGHPEVDPAQVLRAATIDGATALGLDALVGSLEVGKRADIALIDLDQPHLTPVHDVPALLVHAAGRGDVTDVLVDGIIVVRERRSTQVDTPELLDRCRARAREAATAAHEVEEA
ncbi:amidohydrolase family protein [Knoellia sp. CPCC 206450]|uniref:amidohydrolase family protein n=1 Tax=Knoellia tibetensis TaxID=3404798 RepID=UPI003B42E542